MAAHLVTYWWFAPEPSGTGVTAVQAPKADAPFPHVRSTGPPPYPRYRAIASTPVDAVDAFLNGMAIARGVGAASEIVDEIEVAILSVVTRQGDDLQVVGPYYVSEGKIWTEDVDVLSLDVDAAEGHVGGDYGDTAYVVTGTVGGDDTRLRQRVHANDVQNAVSIVVTWLDEVHDAADDAVAIWSVVEAGPDETTAYIPVAAPGPVLSPVSEPRRWLAGEFRRDLGVPLGAPTSGPGIDPKDVATINRYRARIGGTPVDLSAGWTADELRTMADNIRTKGRDTNPDARRLKNRLLS